jgi:hypothetical protein
MILVLSAIIQAAIGISLLLLLAFMAIVRYVK